MNPLFAKILKAVSTTSDSFPLIKSYRKFRYQLHNRKLTGFVFYFTPYSPCTGPFITEISVTASHLDTYAVESAHYMPQPEVEEEIDSLQELEMLEKELMEQRAEQQ